METASFCSENSLTKSVSTKPRKFKESFSLFDHSDKKKKELYTAILVNPEAITGGVL